MDTETVINEAQAPEAFDVLAFLEDTAYPTEKVTVFRDLTAAKEYKKLVDERLLDEKDLDAKDGPTERDERIKTLGEQITNSAMIFEFRGMPPGIVNEIIGGENETPEEAEAKDNALIAKSIVAVTNSKGAVDNHLWTEEQVAQLRSRMVEGEFAKLIAGVASVNFNGAVFDQATDAGFSGRRSDVA